MLKRAGCLLLMDTIWRVDLQLLFVRSAPTWEELHKELTGEDYHTVILFLTAAPWRSPLVQRPQQLARALAEQGALILYSAGSTDCVRRTRKLSHGLWLINEHDPVLKRKINESLRQGGKRRFTDVYSTDLSISQKKLEEYRREGWTILYEYVDALSGEISRTVAVPKRLLERFSRAMRDETVFVTATAQSLYDDALRRHGQAGTLLNRNGVNIEFFAHPDRFAVLAPSFAPLLADGRPLLCYYGALAAWLDYELLLRLCACGRYHVVLIGVDYDGSSTALKGAGNLTILPSMPLEQLRDHAARCDLFLLPFKSGTLADATSPVKLFEYMALGKPIVSTDMAECKRYRSVLWASDRDAFLEMVEQGLRLQDDAAYKKLLRREAEENTWALRARELLSALEVFSDGRRSSATLPHSDVQRS